MIRIITILVVLAMMVAAAVFVADRPGQVEIVWQGWQVDTSVRVAIAAVVLAGLLVALLFRVLALILGGPRALLRRRRERRRRAGYRALVQGLIAVAAGDAREALRYARRADAGRADPSLTLLLSAQAAQLDGDDTATKRFFTAMLNRPETEFVGLRGLLDQAMRAGDRSTALRLAGRAMALRPGARSVTQSLFDLQVREGQWEAARETLAQAVNQRIISTQRAQHHRGVILYELSRAAAQTGDRQRAIGLAAQAQAMTADLATPAAHHARLLLEEERERRAAKAVERAWRTAPHPELARIYWAICEGQPTLTRVKSFERLAAQNPAARESHLALAEAAFAAQLWGEARRHLKAALAAAAPPRPEAPLYPLPLSSPRAGDDDDQGLVGPTARMCLLLARLEEAEHGTGEGMREWLDRAITAIPDPRYVCSNCGGESLEWYSRCPHCSAFDVLAWHTPAWASLGRTLTLAAQPPALPEPASLPLAPPTGGAEPQSRLAPA